MCAIAHRRAPIAKDHCRCWSLPPLEYPSSPERMGVCVSAASISQASPLTGIDVANGSQRGGFIDTPHGKADAREAQSLSHPAAEIGAVAAVSIGRRSFCRQTVPVHIIIVRDVNCFSPHRYCIICNGTENIILLTNDVRRFSHFTNAHAHEKPSSNIG